MRATATSTRSKLPVSRLLLIESETESDGSSEISPIRLEDDEKTWEATAQELDQVRTGVARVLEDLVLLRKGFTKSLTEVSQLQGEGKTLLQAYQTLSTDMADAAAQIPVRQGKNRHNINVFIDNMRAIALACQNGLTGDWLEPLTATEGLLKLDQACADMLPQFGFMKPLIKAPEVVRFQDVVQRQWTKQRSKLLLLHERLQTVFSNTDDLTKLADGLRVPYAMNVWRYNPDLYKAFNAQKKSLVAGFESLAQGQDVPAAIKEIDEAFDTVNRILQAMQQYVEDYPAAVQRYMRETKAGVEELARRVYLRTSHKRRSRSGAQWTVELTADQARVLRFNAPTRVVLNNLSIEDLRRLLRD